MAVKLSKEKRIVYSIVPYIHGCGIPLNIGPTAYYDEL